RNQIGQDDLWPRSIFFVAVWQGSARAVFSMFIPAQCQTPHVVPGRDRTSGEGRRGSASSTGQEEDQWTTGASQREQESQPSGGGAQPIAPFYPRAHQELVAADWRRLQGGVLYF